MSRRRRGNRKKFMGVVIIIEILVIAALVVGLLIFNFTRNKDKQNKNPNAQNNTSNQIEVNQGSNQQEETDTENELSKEEQEALAEQERLKAEEEKRKELIAEADKLTLSYDYDKAIEMIKAYQGEEGDYSVYKSFVEAITKYETERDACVLYGGVYKSVTEASHIFFHSLVADNSKAFDGDYDQTGYNMYMTTTYEFLKMMESMYKDGYVLVSIKDLYTETTDENGNIKYVANKFYLPQGKKPFVLSQDDVNYYDYMDGDGFASRIVIGEDGKPTCEMIMDDGTKQYGDFDVVPILDKFIEEHPDFSYRGAKGILALTGYEGALGYRTDDPTSPTYEEDVKAATAVAECLKENGWEFACHGWGHKNAQTITESHFKTDTQRWLDEVAPIIGGSDIYIFPYGVDFETTMGHYESGKYKFAKENGFNVFCGVYSKPWMHIKSDYIRMTRRPLDGQAMLQFPERLEDLFDVPSIIDPERPARDW